MYQYRAFGLNIESGFRIEELLPAVFELADVVFELKDIPEAIEAPLASHLGIELNENQLIFKVAEVADFYVENGVLIRMQRHPGVSEHEANLYLLGTAMGALLMQRGIVALHGSVLHGQGRTIVISGASGVGKSSLSRAFLKNGYRMLSDDVAPVRAADLGFRIAPTYPAQKLWKDTMAYHELEDKGLRTVANRMEKYHVPIGEGFHDQDEKLDCFVQIMKHPGDEVILRRLQGLEAVTALIRNTYRLAFYRASGRAERHFQLCGMLAKEIRVYELLRPEKGFTVQQQYEAIEKEVGIG